MTTNPVAPARINTPVPNAETIEALKAARLGELVSAGSPDKLLESLNSED